MLAAAHPYPFHEGITFTIRRMTRKDPPCAAESAAQEPRLRELPLETATAYLLEFIAATMRFAVAQRSPESETGLRLGEALALKWSDIELDAANGKKLGYLFVREREVKECKAIRESDSASSGDAC